MYIDAFQIKNIKLLETLYRHLNQCLTTFDLKVFTFICRFYSHVMENLFFLPPDKRSLLSEQIIYCLFIID